MAAEQENSQQSTGKLHIRKQVLAGAAVLLVLLGGLFAYWLWSKGAPAEVPEEPVIGVLDMQQLMEAHPDYKHLKEIEQEITHLEGSLAMEELKLQIPEPQTDPQLFQEAVGQKTRLDNLARHAQLMDELNELAEQKRQELKPQLEAERKEAEAPYLNEILNLRLKLDSADVLEISQEQQQQMLDRIDVLQRERAQVIEKLSQDQERRFQEIMAAEAAEPLAELKKIKAQEQQEMQQTELDKQLEAQARNAKAMEEAVSPIAVKISRARKQTMLEARKIQLQQLQTKIYSDIAGRAAKLAILHKLTLILSSPADNLRGIDYQSGQFSQMNQWQPELSPVIGVNTIDLTAEMLQEMQTQPFQALKIDDSEK